MSDFQINNLEHLELKAIFGSLYKTDINFIEVYLKDKIFDKLQAENVKDIPDHYPQHLSNQCSLRLLPDSEVKQHHGLSGHPTLHRYSFPLLR